MLFIANARNRRKEFEEYQAQKKLENDIQEKIVKEIKKAIN